MNDVESALIFTGTPERLTLSFRGARRPVELWKKEVELAAQRIYHRANKPIWVCLSGGIDSELICHVFLELKIPFQVLTVEHKGGGNHDDTVWARNWCEAHGVSQKTVLFDADWFFSDYIPDRLKTGFYSPCPFRFFQLFLMETIESMGGFGVLGVGEQRYFFDHEKKEAFLDLDTGLLSVQTYASNRHSPYFFYANPEIMLAYMKDPLVRATLENPQILEHTENIFLLKRMVYQTHYPHLKTRNKLTGWESVALKFAVAASRLEKATPGRTRYLRITASELADQLRGRS